MIHTREHLIHVLTEAAEIEHNLLCSYLYAAFSLKRAGEPGLSDRQAEAVERWRKTVLGICRQEMAHLAAVNNLLAAIGGAPHFDRPNFPVAPGYHPAGLVARLTPFTRETLDHFIFLEKSEQEALEDAPGFEPGDLQRAARRGAFTPSADDYETIGALYDAIAQGFRAIAALGDGKELFPPGAPQFDEAMARLPGVRPIRSLADALATVEHIKEEGEGSASLGDESHFQRFCAIREEWAALAAADGEFEPAWPAAHDPVMRKPIAGADRVWITAEPAASYLDLGNAIYGLMLQMLVHAFVAPGRIASRQAAAGDLMNAAVELMEATGAVASALARLPASADHPGVNAGISFAMPRNLGFRPAGGPALVERLEQLRAGAARILAGEAAEKAERRLSAALDLLNGVRQ